MLLLRDITYTHPNKELLFKNINLSLKKGENIALVGNNGTGKSTLLRLIAGKLQPLTGEVLITGTCYYIPQLSGQYDRLTVAQALGIEAKLQALQEVLNGNVTEHQLHVLNDDWMLEERCQEAMRYWRLNDISLTQYMHTLSGGQKTKVFLSGIEIHQPELVLMDEPSNHLDIAGRELLYQFIEMTDCTLIAVSHDRKLLRRLPVTAELTAEGLKLYGGNYDFYLEQKQIDDNALHDDIHNKEKELRKARKKERESLERQQKLDARGKQKQEKAGVARIMMNTLRNKAEASTAKTKSAHSEKTNRISEELHQLRNEVPDLDKMQFQFAKGGLHHGKVLFSAKGINYLWNGRRVWKNGLDLQINSGERIAVTGDNGSGKTTLLRIITGELTPEQGDIYRAEIASVYIDQGYSLLDDALTVYEQAQQFNDGRSQEHEIKIRLNRFLFSSQDWDKRVKELSGGERMKLVLCCLMIKSNAPDLIVLDEPTNNLDIQNVEVLTAAINAYQGTLVVVSHDAQFLEDINIRREVRL